MSEKTLRVLIEPTEEQVKQAAASHEAYTKEAADALKHRERMEGIFLDMLAAGQSQAQSLASMAASLVELQTLARKAAES